MGKKKSRRQNEDGGLSITSMMDMMTIILVFLLKSYNTDSIAVAPSKDLQVPLSSAQKPPKLAVNVVVSQSEIVVDGERVLALERQQTAAGDVAGVPESEKRGQMINPLYDRLLEKAETAKDLAMRTGGEDFEFKGEILLQCDKRLPFSVIREVMFTAGQAQFGNFRFVVIKGG